MDKANNLQTDKTNHEAKTFAFFGFRRGSAGFARLFLVATRSEAS